MTSTFVSTETGTAQGCAFTTLTLPVGDASQVDDYYVGTEIILNSGSGATQERSIIQSRLNQIKYSQDYTNAAWVKSALLTVTANTTIAPDGTLTADTITDNDAVNPQLIQQPVNSGVIPPIGTIQTESVHVFAGTAPQSVFNCYDTGNTENSLIVNWTAGVPSASSFAGPTGASYTITPIALAAGWYRLSITWQTSFAGVVQHCIWPCNRNTPTQTGTIVVWGSQSEVGPVATAYIYTAATPAVGVTVGKWSTNLSQYSEDQLNALYTTASIHGVITASALPDSAGGFNAFTYTEDTSTAGRYIGTPSSTVVAGVNYVVSMEFQAGTGAARYAGLVLNSAQFGGNVIVSFTLSGAGSAVWNGIGTNVATSITDIGGGWYRCAVTAQCTTGGFSTTQLRISNSPSNGAATYLGDGVSNINMAHYQFELGTVPTPYAQTGASRLFMPDSTTQFSIGSYVAVAPALPASSTFSSAIGSFAIGQSSIGDTAPFDINTTVISQYANSPILMQLVSNLFTYEDQTQNSDNLFDSVWSIETAVGPALDAWGRVVGVQRVLPVATGNYFGFHQQGEANAGNFSNSNWYSGQHLTSNYALSDDAFRQLILAKAAFNLSDCSIHSINTLLLTLFPNRGKCFVADNGAMHMTYTFKFSLTPAEQSIVVNSGVLPRPSGVSVAYSY